MKADGGVITQIRVLLPEPVETNFPYYPDLVSDRHLYRISALVCETLFHGKTGGGVAKCRLFSQTTLFHSLLLLTVWIKFPVISLCEPSFCNTIHQLVLTGQCYDIVTFVLR